MLDEIIKYTVCTVTDILPSDARRGFNRGWKCVAMSLAKFRLECDNIRKDSSHQYGEQGRMPGKIKLFFALTFSALLISMCRFYDAGERVTPINGLSCQAYTDYFDHGLGSSNGLECYYACPKEVVGPLDYESD